jgi:hypothetical protein
MSAGKTVVAEYAFALAAKVWLTSLIFLCIFFVNYGHSCFLFALLFVVSNLLELQRLLEYFIVALRILIYVHFYFCKYIDVPHTFLQYFSMHCTSLFKRSQITCIDMS